MFKLPEKIIRKPVTEEKIVVTQDSTAPGNQILSIYVFEV